MCRRHGICFIADGAQVCGVLPVNMQEDNINILCMPGHKGLFGISGTGLMITDGKFPIYHIMEGGTGSTSLELEQTPFLPEGLESGTVNTVGIVSVGAGIDFINRYGHDRISDHENALCSRFIAGLERLDGVRIYRRDRAKYLPIVLFNLDGICPKKQHHCSATGALPSVEDCTARVLPIRRQVRSQTALSGFPPHASTQPLKRICCAELSETFAAKIIIKGRNTLPTFVFEYNKQ